MFEISLAEFALIAIVALLVLGPERLPGAARTVGGLVRRARASWSSLRSEIERELAIKDAANSIASVADPVRNSLTQLHDEMRSVARDVDPLAAPQPGPSPHAAAVADPQAEDPRADPKPPHE
jgi:sec-independent protein translocase protein TatB